MKFTILVDPSFDIIMYRQFVWSWSVRGKREKKESGIVIL